MADRHIMEIVKTDGRYRLIHTMGDQKYRYRVRSVDELLELAGYILRTIDEDTAAAPVPEGGRQRPVNNLRVNY